MFFDADKNRLKVGYKETMKAVNNNTAQKVYIADDCDDKLKASVETASEAINAQIFHIDSMKELGKLCGINISASCAAVLK